MTPVMNAASAAEKHYNKMHAKTRSKVERCIGVLKNRFRCLLGERKLLYNHEKAAKIITSCVVLHNYLNLRGEEIDDSLDGVDDEIIDERVQNRVSTNFTLEGRRIREELISALSQNM